VPFAQQVALRLQRLDGLDGRDRLDEQRLLHRGFVRGGRDPPADPVLRDEADRQCHEEGAGRNDDDPARHQIDDDQEDEDEDRIDEHADRVGGEEFADEFVLRDAARIFAGLHGPCRHAGVEHLLEEQIGKLEVGAAAGIVDQRGPGGLQHEVEEDRARDAERQHPERRLGVVRQDAVVDVHREERRGERQQIDEQGGDGDLRIGAPERNERAYQPVLAHDCAVPAFDGGFHRIRADRAEGQHCPDAFPGGQAALQLAAHGLDIGRIARPVDFQQRDCGSVVEKDDGGQVEIAGGEIAPAEGAYIEADTVAQALDVLQRRHGLFEGHARKEDDFRPRPAEKDGDPLKGGPEGFSADRGRLRSGMYNAGRFGGQRHGHRPRKDDGVVPVAKSEISLPLKPIGPRQSMRIAFRSLLHVGQQVHRQVVHLP